MGVEVWNRERLEPAVSFINAVVESVTEGGSVWEGVGLGRLIVGVAVWDFSIWGLSGVREEGLSLVGGSITVSVRRGTGKCFASRGYKTG